MVTKWRNNEQLAALAALIPALWLAVFVYMLSYSYRINIVYLLFALAAIVSFLLWESFFRLEACKMPPEAAVLLIALYALIVTDTIPLISLISFWSNNILYMTDGEATALYILLDLSICFLGVWPSLLLINMFKTGIAKKRSLMVRLLHFFTSERYLRRGIALRMLFCGAILSLLVWPISLILAEMVMPLWLSLLLVVWLTVAVFMGWLLHRNGLLGQMEKISEMVAQLASGEILVENPLRKEQILADVAEKLTKTSRIVEENVKRAMAGEKMKVELITNVSHDLKTPLTSIIGYGELLEQLELSPQAREYADKINHKSKYLLTMVEDLLDLSKASTGNAVLAADDLDFVRLVRQCVAEMFDAAGEAEREIIFRCHDDEALPVTADGVRMHRVIQNLLDNAIKYSLSGTRIYAEVSRRGNAAVLELINTAGYVMTFSPDKIVERFARGSSARTGEGSGLGLAIAKTYTEACGGQFQVSIKGDQFLACVSLPLRQDAPSDVA